MLSYLTSIEEDPWSLSPLYLHPSHWCTTSLSLHKADNEGEEDTPLALIVDQGVVFTWRQLSWDNEDDKPVTSDNGWSTEGKEESEATY